MLKLRVNDIRQLILQLFELLAEKLNALIDLFLRVALPVSYFLAPIIKLLLHRSVVGLQFIGLIISLFVQLFSVLLVRLQSNMNLFDLRIVVQEVILLLLELLDNLLLVFIELPIIVSEVLIDSLKLLFHSTLDIFSPPLQFFDLILQDLYVTFAPLRPLPQE